MIPIEIPIVTTVLKSNNVFLRTVYMCTTHTVLKLIPPPPDPMQFDQATRELF